MLAVQEGALIIKFAPETSENQWFILKSCYECYAGLNKLVTVSTPHLYVNSDSYGDPFMAASNGRMAWFEIMESACKK